MDGLLALVTSHFKIDYEHGLNICAKVLETVDDSQKVMTLTHVGGNNNNQLFLDFRRRQVRRRAFIPY